MSGVPGPDLQRVRETLDDLCSLRGVSSAELAERSGLAHSQVHHDRYGNRKITPKRLAAYCRAFEVADQIALVTAYLSDIISPSLMRRIEVRVRANHDAGGAREPGYATVGRGVDGAPPSLREALDRLADACVADRELLRAVRIMVGKLLDRVV